MSRKLRAVNYKEFCSEHKINAEGIYRFFHQEHPAILLSPELLNSVASVLEYRFSAIPIHNDTDGFLLVWDKSDYKERDRCYMMCAYCLRGTMPDVWNLPDV